MNPLPKRPNETRRNFALCYPARKDPAPGKFVGVTRCNGQLWWVLVQVNDDATVSVELAPKEDRAV